MPQKMWVQQTKCLCRFFREISEVNLSLLKIFKCSFFAVSAKTSLTYVYIILITWKWDYVSQQQETSYFWWLRPRKHVFSFLVSMKVLLLPLWIPSSLTKLRRSRERYVLGRYERILSERTISSDYNYWKLPRNLMTIGQLGLMYFLAKINDYWILN